MKKIEDILILPQTVVIKWNSRNKNLYMSKGYNFTKMGNDFSVDILDLPIKSKYKVKCICQYCKLEIEKPYCYVVSDIETTCCNKCKNEKAKSFNLEKYGVEYVFQAKQTKDSIKKTLLDKYGVEYISQAPGNREKYKKTCIVRYGVTNPSLDPEIKRRAVISDLKTKYQHGTIPCSKQQKYLHNLLGGELNYPVDRAALDIAFSNKKIYVEYDGSGHDLSVKLGADKHDFDRREFKRKQFLQSQGWKLIRIISKKDYLPQDKEIIDLIEECKYYLNEGHSWIEIDIDNRLMRCSQFKKKIEMNLRKL